MSEAMSEWKLKFLPFQHISQFERFSFLLKTDYFIFIFILKNDMKQKYHSLDNLDLATSQTTVQLNLHKQTEQLRLLVSFMKTLTWPTWVSSALRIAKLWAYNFLHFILKVIWYDSSNILVHKS